MKNGSRFNRKKAGGPQPPKTGVQPASGSKSKKPKGRGSVPLAASVQKLLSGLNNEQLAAATAPAGPVLVLAGAGSGKTRVLVTRIAHLVAERGAAPQEVVALTFSNRA